MTFKIFFITIYIVTIKYHPTLTIIIQPTMAIVPPSGNVLKIQLSKYCDDEYVV
jgi:hypothetical protein